MHEEGEKENNGNNKGQSSMKFSVITISYNNAEGLRKTMESVFSKSCRSGVLKPIRASIMR